VLGGKVSAEAVLLSAGTADHKKGLLFTVV
jgi:hypothetical protein